jgi:hypothetical protein
MSTNPILSPLEEEKKEELSKPISTQPIPFKKKSKAGRSLSTVDLNWLEKGCRTVLRREINHLLDMSHKGPLERDQSVALMGYLKAIRDLKKDEDAAMAELSDEELTKLANK